MLKLRQAHMEALRPVVNAQVPQRVLEDLEGQGIVAKLDSKTNTIVATDARGFQTHLHFHPNGLPLRLVQPSGLTYGFEHDSKGYLAAVTYPGGERVETRRDDRGNVAEIRRPGVLTYQMEYDDQDRLGSIRHPTGSTTRLAYCFDGSLESVTDRTGAVTRYERDESGRLLAVIDPLGRTTAHEIDGEGVVAVVLPDGTRQDCVLDSESKMAVVSTRGGRQLVHELDDDGRVVAIDAGDGARTEYGWDSSGRLEKVGNSSGQIIFSYDAEGNPLTEVTQDCVITYSYDSDGQLSSVASDLGEPTSYEYDPDGRLSVVRCWGDERRFTYGPDGAIAEVVYGGGLKERCQYSPLGRIINSVVTNRKGELRCEQIYEYDSTERLTRFVDRWGSSVSHAYSRRLTYDAEDRILSESDEYARRTISDYEYDAKGNMIRFNGSAIRVGLMDEPLSFGSATLDYDAEGNMVRLPGDGGLLRCSFSAYGTLQAANLNEVETTFKYDPMGRRIGKSVANGQWSYGWAGDQLLWEEFCDESGMRCLRRDYAYLPGEVTPFGFREDGVTYWLHVDSRGVPIYVFNSAGHIVWHATYDGFGLPEVDIEDVRQPWRLEGQYADSETGLSYNLLRYYSPRLKSYLSMDPNWDEPEATNYSYGHNNPWNRSDPLGAIAPLVAALLRAAVPVIARGAVWLGRAAGRVAPAVFAALSQLGRRALDACYRCVLRFGAALAPLLKLFGKKALHFAKWMKGQLGKLSAKIKEFAKRSWLIVKARIAMARAARNADKFSVGKKHTFGAGGRWGKFDKGIDPNAALRDALRSKNAKILPNDKTSFKVITDLGRPIGTKGETAVRAILDFNGKVVTWFPVKL